MIEHEVSPGYWLRRRKARDLTQAELAARAGCALTTIKKIETGARQPSRRLLARLTAVLALPSDERAALPAGAGTRRGQEAAAHLGGWHLPGHVVGVGNSAFQVPVAAGAAGGRAERLCRTAEAVDRGTHVRVVDPVAAVRENYERLPATSEALIYIAMIRLMVRRLAHL
jgi:transcriptional regulator with XRE-family HTH domain